MAMIGLTGYVVAPERSQVPKQVTLGNVNLPSGMVPPSPGLTLLYGFRDTLGEIKRQYSLAEAEGKRLFSFRLDVDVGDIPSSRITLADLEHIRFLHLGRLTAEVENLILKKWMRYIPEDWRERAAEQAAARSSDEELERALPYRYNQFLIGRPDLMSRLHEEPEFRHLDAIVYRLAGDEMSRFVCTLFRTTGVRSIECLDEQMKVDVPKLKG